MASASIRTRARKSGLRFEVRYRLGGRSSKQQLAGTFSTYPEAERVLEQVRATIARGATTPAVPPDQSRLVYIARLFDRIKIGVAKNPEQRCRILNADLLVTMEGSFAYERELHRRFAAHRVRGEWFEAAPELLDFIESAKQSQRRARRAA